MLKIADCSCSKKREIRKFVTDSIIRLRPDLSLLLKKQITEEIVKVAMNDQSGRNDSISDASELKKAILEELRNAGFQIDYPRNNIPKHTFIKKDLATNTPKRRILKASSENKENKAPKPTSRSFLSSNLKPVDKEGTKINRSLREIKSIDFLVDSLEDISMYDEPMHCSTPRKKKIDDSLEDKIKVYKKDNTMDSLNDSLRVCEVKDYADSLEDLRKDLITPNFETRSPKKIITYQEYIDQNKTSSAPRKRRQPMSLIKSDSKVRKSILFEQATSCTEPKKKFDAIENRQESKAKRSISFVRQEVPPALNELYKQRDTHISKITEASDINIIALQICKNSLQRTETFFELLAEVDALHKRVSDIRSSIWN